MKHRSMPCFYIYIYFRALKHRIREVCHALSLCVYIPLCLKSTRIHGDEKTKRVPRNTGHESKF